MFGTVTSEDELRQEFDNLMVVRRQEKKTSDDAREAAKEAIRAENARKRALAEARKAAEQGNSVQTAQ